MLSLFEIFMIPDYPNKSVYQSLKEKDLEKKQTNPNAGKNELNQALSNEAHLQRYREVAKERRPLRRTVLLPRE